MNSYLDEAIWEGLILESAIATPYSVEENIKRGKEAMRHVISSHKIEPRAMYREDLGWVGFSWGEPGNAPPIFNNKEDAVRWWNTLPGKTNIQKGSKVYSGGRGVSHIIAKRDFEAKWMGYFKNQSGVTIAMKCVEVIAKGSMRAIRQKREIVYGNMCVSLVADSRWIESRDSREKGKKREDFWLLSGFEIIHKDENYRILESVGFADEHESAGYQSEGMLATLRHSPRTLEREPLMPTHTEPTVCSFCMGAANSNEIINGISDSVNLGWLYDL